MLQESFVAEELLDQWPLVNIKDVLGKRLQACSGNFVTLLEVGNAASAQKMLGNIDTTCFFFKKNNNRYTYILVMHTHTYFIFFRNKQ